MSQANVLFVCIHNAGRSQMAAALFERAVGGRRQARSAGSAPASTVNPVVVEALAELGVDISDRVPHRLSADDVAWAQVVVTMGCGDECPYLPGKRYVDWDIRDPAGQGLEVVREIRDEIARRVERLVAQLDAGGDAGRVA